MDSTKSSNKSKRKAIKLNLYKGDINELKENNISNNK